VDVPDRAFILKLRLLTKPKIIHLMQVWEATRAMKYVPFGLISTKAFLYEIPRFKKSGDLRQKKDLTKY
jgi:hypothetical protein